MTSHLVTYAYCQAFNDLLDNIKVIQYLFEKAVRGDRQKDMTKGNWKLLWRKILLKSVDCDTPHFFFQTALTFYIHHVVHLTLPRDLTKIFRKLQLSFCKVRSTHLPGWNSFLLIFWRVVFFLLIIWHIKGGSEKNWPYLHYFSAVSFLYLKILVPQFQCLRYSQIFWRVEIYLYYTCCVVGENCRSKILLCE